MSHRYNNSVQSKKLRHPSTFIQLCWIVSILAAGCLLISTTITAFGDRVKSTGPAIIFQKSAPTFSWLNSEELVAHMNQGDFILCLEQLVMPLICLAIIVMSTRALLIKSTFPIETSSNHYP